MDNLSILGLINPASILKKKKSDYLIDFLLNESEDVAITINQENIDITKKLLIPGNKENIKLNYELNQNIKSVEDNFGIISYSDSFKYGKKQDINIKQPHEVKEPIRIIYDIDIHTKYIDIFKKLILVNTEYDNKEYYNKSIKDIIYLLDNYKAEYTIYKTLDTSERLKGLSGKYHDCLQLYQKYYEKNIECENKNEQRLIDWYCQYLEIVNLLAQDVTNKLNKLFPKNIYYFQNNHPVRISKPGSLGTPLHQDSQSILINNDEINDYKNPSYHPIINDDNTSYIEIEQDKHIFNFNYVIYEDYPNQTLRICTNEIDKMEANKSYFLRVKQNFINEGFLFNPSNRLHFRTNQYKGYSIRGDFRIINVNKYKESKIWKNKGPRVNLNVCFGTKKDCENEKYHIFMNKIYS